jgi:hypothetical protein
LTEIIYRNCDGVIFRNTENYPNGICMEKINQKRMILTAERLHKKEYLARCISNRASS